jgi:cytoskeletal protein CcmA (bactofilin family)
MNFQPESALLEVKRKSNDSQSTRGTATAAARAYQPTHFDRAQSRVPEVMDETERAPAAVPVLVPAPRESSVNQTRTPVITGEAHYKGMLPIDGIVAGQLGANGGSLAVRQKSNAYAPSRPELAGEISFKDMLRVNGHIAGTVYSKTGTLIIDNSARVDANVEVAVAIISGTMHGDLVAHQRVELGPSAKIYGNIWTRSIAIKDGAIFDGVCTMIEAKPN